MKLSLSVSGARVEFEKDPITWADFIIVFPIIATEIVSACSSSSAEADARLEDIGSRLLDLSNRVTDPRSRLLVSALAKQLIATEEGA